MPSVPVERRKCRAGCQSNETLSHILQICPQTHTQRIHRHDHVVKRLTKIAEKNKWLDLIFFNNTDVIICDVSICWEGPRPLAIKYHLKICKYSNSSLIQQIQRIFSGKKLSIALLIIGSSGVWCNLNRSLQEHLKISKSDVAELINTTIKGNLVAHKCFMQSVWELMFKLS